jgi:hypothetical protein
MNFGHVYIFHAELGNYYWWDIKDFSCTDDHQIDN